MKSATRRAGGSVRRRDDPCARSHPPRARPGPPGGGAGPGGAAAAAALASVVLAAVAGGSTIGAAVAAAPAGDAPRKTMCVASGRSAFLEKEYNDLRYAGVVDVVPGTLADGGGAIEGVCVSYDPSKLTHERLMQTYWRRSDPVQAGGQFGEKGARYQGAVWVDGDAERAEVEANIGRLERSGVLGKDARVATRVLDGPAAMTPFPDADRRALASNPKAFERDRAVRTREFNRRWGFVQYCANRVCGYVRFAPACERECLEVFPEYVERNANMPSLGAGDVKITGRS